MARHVWGKNVNDTVTIWKIYIGGKCQLLRKDKVLVVPSAEKNSM